MKWGNGTSQLSFNIIPVYPSFKVLNTTFSNTGFFLNGRVIQLAIIKMRHPRPLVRNPPLTIRLCVYHEGTNFWKGSELHEIVLMKIKPRLGVFKRSVTTWTRKATSVERRSSHASCGTASDCTSTLNQGMRGNF